MISRRLSFLGLLPLAFGLVNLLENWRQGIAWNALWLCHVSDFVLGLGLLLRWPTLARLAVLNMIAGCALWIRYVTYVHYASWFSALAHLGGTTVGLVSMRWLRASRWAWVHAFLFMVCVQIVCFRFTSEALNINLSTRFFTALLGRPVPPSEPRFMSFIIEASFGLGLFLINRLLLDVFPRREDAVENAAPANIMEESAEQHHNV